MKRSETKAGPKFRVGQVVADRRYVGCYGRIKAIRKGKHGIEYEVLDCMAGKCMEIPRSETHHFVEGRFIEFILRPLTLRESGQRQRKGIADARP